MRSRTDCLVVPVDAGHYLQALRVSSFTAVDAEATMQHHALQHDLAGRGSCASESSN